MKNNKLREHFADSLIDYLIEKTKRHEDVNIYWNPCVSVVFKIKNIERYPEDIYFMPYGTELSTSSLADVSAAFLGFFEKFGSPGVEKSNIQGGLFFWSISASLLLAVLHALDDVQTIRECTKDANTPEEFLVLMRFNLE